MYKNVVGLAALLETFDNLKGAATNKDIVKSSRDAAFQLRDHVRANAPKGPTGNLRRGIEAGTFKVRPGQPVMSFVRASFKKAPHTHLVEFGGRGGAMPANPFFRRSTASGADAALSVVLAGAESAVDKALK